MRERSIPRPLYLAEYNFLRVPFSVVLIFCFVSMIFHVWKHDQSARTLAKQLRFNDQVSFKTHREKSLCSNNDRYCDRSVSCLLWDVSTL